MRGESGQGAQLEERGWVGLSRTARNLSGRQARNGTWELRRVLSMKTPKFQAKEFEILAWEGQGGD